MPNSRRSDASEALKSSWASRTSSMSSGGGFATASTGLSIIARHDPEHAEHTRSTHQRSPDRSTDVTEAPSRRWLHCGQGNRWTCSRRGPRSSMRPRHARRLPSWKRRPAATTQAGPREPAPRAGPGSEHVFCRSGPMSRARYREAPTCRSALTRVQACRSIGASNPYRGWCVIAPGRRGADTAPFVHAGLAPAP